MKHRRTDPACHYHRPPTSWLARLRYDRARGRGCDVCMSVRALVRTDYWRTWPGGIWRDGRPEPDDAGREETPR